jgi:hypothetical protein
MDLRLSTTHEAQVVDVTVQQLEYVNLLRRHLRLQAAASTSGWNNDLTRSATTVVRSRCCREGCRGTARGTPRTPLTVSAED